MATMFERYGGFATVSKVVLTFYDKAIDSDIIGKYFENVDMPALIDHQTKFVSQVMGGPASWKRDDTIRRAIEIHCGVVQNPKILSFQGRDSGYPHVVSRGA